MMRILIALLMLSRVAFAEAPAKMITFNRADTEHCKVIVVGGKPLLETTFEGTSVAIALPVNRGNGEFLVFVAIARADHGAVQVNPGDIYGVFSDAAHTRFSFYDSAAETQGPSGDSSMEAERKGIDPGSLRPGAQLGGASSGGGSTGLEPPGEGGAGAPGSAGYLHKAKIKQGEKAMGWVALRPAKGSNVDVHATDMLDQVNIPVNGVLFRF